MPLPDTCLACGNQIHSEERICRTCDARVDEAVLDEVRAIDYLLAEIPRWREWLPDKGAVRRAIRQHYEGRRAALVGSLLPAPAVSAPAAAPTPSAVQPEGLAPPAPELAPLAAVLAAPVEPLPPRASVTEPAPPVMAAEAAPETERGRRSLPELVAENIKLIFAISASLFVGGVLLYYRNEIYHGLKQPVTQAGILALITVVVTVAGWVLVRRTEQNLAGLTLTLVGSLLVPINPWFLVRSGLIPNTGNGWILGLACTALYGWTAYFLRERLFVYIALATGAITTWAAVQKFAGGSAGSRVIRGV